MEALEARQDAILTRLEELKEQVKAYKKSLGLSDLPPPKACVSKTADIVIRCSPSYPAFTLKSIYSMLTANGYAVHATSHTHCSVNSLPPNVQSFLPITDIPRSSAQVRITLIWSEVGKDCELMVSPLVQTSIKGESNILRYFSRLFPTIFPYESLSNLMAVDNMLDSVSSLLWATPKERQPIMRTLAVNLVNGSYLAGSLSIADLALYSAIRQMNFEKDLQPDLMKWYLTISKQLDGKANRNRNRNSSMRKSTCSPKKAEKGRTPDKDASPKDSVKKNKSPAKEVKIEKCPPKKSGKTKKNQLKLKPTDLETNNAPGSIFTRQWPEIKHIFQSLNLKTYIENAHYGSVAEKLDGSNVAVSSKRIIASRRNILLSNPNDDELKAYKFSGVNFSNLCDVFDQLDILQNHFSSFFPFLQIEILLYGELIQKGTATCKDDKYRYRSKGYGEGELYFFGGGLAFEDDLEPYELEKISLRLKEKGFSTICQEDEYTGRNYFIIFMNTNFCKLLIDFGFSKVIPHEQMTVKNALNIYLPKLLNDKIEGIVMNFGDEILKWKGVEEGYPDQFLNEIKTLENCIDDNSYKAIESVALKAREIREASVKRKSANILLEKAFKSALSKLQNPNDVMKVSEEDMIQFKQAVKVEMLKDCQTEVEYKKRLDDFLDLRIS